MEYVRWVREFVCKFCKPIMYKCNHVKQKYKLVRHPVCPLLLMTQVTKVCALALNTSGNFYSSISMFPTMACDFVQVLVHLSLHIGMHTYIVTPCYLHHMRTCSLIDTPLCISLTLTHPLRTSTHTYVHWTSTCTFAWHIDKIVRKLTYVDTLHIRTCITHRTLTSHICT
jgi:hypothetical protein